MADIISVLPDTVANQIAAGEVIQRPASVIKELVENAIDAGASHIDVLVEEAGRTSIQVIDDGKGMSETDARMAFERHATSKIRKADDLFSLHTMGFRGEALPSIVAVAQVTLRTRTDEQELGTSLQIEGGRVLSQEVVACPVGSNFLVQNLFFNVPARRKFLKSNQTELNNIVQEFERMALVNPGVSFTFTNNGTLVTTLTSGSVLQRIVGVFGKKLSGQLLSVNVDTTLCRMTGFVGKPESARKKGAYQYFFVNGRYMRHPFFHKAVQEALAGLIPDSEQVPYFLYFDVDPANIDVNIHPTKTEIKFENELAIKQLIIAGIKECLGRYNAVPVIEFDTVDCPKNIPVYNPVDDNLDVKAPDVLVDSSFNPFDTPSRSRQSGRSSRPTEDLSMSETNRQSFPRQTIPSPSTIKSVVPDFLLSDTTPDFPSSLDMELIPKAATSELPFAASNGEEALYDNDVLSEMEKSTEHYQFQGRYILTSVKSGLMIIDQHRAHVRVLYNRYREQMEGQSVPSQGLLFPELIQMSTSDAVLLGELEDDFRTLGFDVTSLGGGTFSLQGVPSGIDGLNPVKLVTEMVAAVKESSRTVHEDLQHRMALTLARNAAIPAGQVLTSQEMSALLDDLFATSTPNYTPDGKTVLAILPTDNITKLFKS